MTRIALGRIGGIPGDEEEEGAIRLLGGFTGSAQRASIAVLAAAKSTATKIKESPEPDTPQKPNLD